MRAITPYTTPDTIYKQGDKVMCNGYPGAIVRLYIPRQPVAGGYSGAMYEVRLPGGVCCTSERDITAMA